MSDSAAPASSGETTNPNDLQAVADSLPDDVLGDYEGHDEGRDTNNGREEEPRRRPERHDRQREARQPRQEAQEPAEQPDEPAEGEEDAEEPPEATQEAGDEGEGDRSEEDEEPEAPKKASKDEVVEVTSVKIDGEEIPVAEIRRGFMRQADYTRKTQEVAGEKRQVQEQAQHLRQQETELAQVLELNIALAQDLMPQAPDVRLLENGPEGVAQYTRQKAYYDAVADRLQKIYGHQSALKQRETQAQQAQHQQRGQHAQQMLAHEFQSMQQKLPELGTVEGRNKFFAEAEKYGGAYGLSAQDIAGIQDHRALLVLKDAMAFRRMQAAKPATVERAKAAPPIRAAARPAVGTRTSSQRAAEERFRRNPTVENGAATLPDSLFE